jgi:hypothetical protein
LDFNRAISLTKLLYQATGKLTKRFYWHGPMESGVGNLLPQGL